MGIKTGDASYIKRLNRSLILKNIIEHGNISRADLARRVGLNKATVSAQVADLLDEELIYETQLEHTSVGRRPTMLSINGAAGYILGIDLDYQHIQFIVSELNGTVIECETIHPTTATYEEIVLLLTARIADYKDRYADCRYGLISVMIGIHGTVGNDEIISYVPKYDWRQKNLKQQLSELFDDVHFHLDNNANLSAYAERVFNYHHSNNLVSVMLTSGIGAGIMINGELHKGYDGFAGEMGHMIVCPDGEMCSCGNRGCWERYASETALIDRLGRKLNRPDLTLDGVKDLIGRQDSTTLDCMDEFLKYLAIGLNNIINLYNPQTLILNSELLRVMPNAIAKVEDMLTSSISNYQELTISSLGHNGCGLGACAFAIQQFLDVPKLVFHAPEIKSTLENATV